MTEHSRSGLSAPQITDSAQQLSPSAQSDATDEKTRKRDFFRFGKKDEDKKKTKTSTGTSHTTSQGGLRPVSPLTGLDASRSPGSPSQNSPYGIAASPRGVRSASPRTHSPASSMIFERNVQEDVAIPQASPQIPSHIVTENHIPPALDATSEAITDRRLNPDAVEIITHAAHQPAAITITEGHHDAHIGPMVSEDQMLLPRTETDNVSNYANLDSLDVRRLSFISFADVVHGEHDFPDARRNSTAITSHNSIGLPRSPSPMRSPVSSAAIGTSPPTSVAPSVHEASPHRAAGDLNIETMRQALRSPRSGDLSGLRSAPLSPLPADESRVERTIR